MTPDLLGALQQSMRAAREGRQPVAPCNCLEGVPGPCNCLDDPAVARTLDVAEATADKARAVGLARETAS
jgi:hypothetical protein